MWGFLPTLGEFYISLFFIQSTITHLFSFTFQCTTSNINITKNYLQVKNTMKEESIQITLTKNLNSFSQIYFKSIKAVKHLKRCKALDLFTITPRTF